MANFLVLQANHQVYEIGIFTETTCIAMHQEDKRYASQNLITNLQLLLQDTHYSLSDFAAIGVNQGPGPFTSLRIAITTVNGLGFATGTPLIGHNSLEALLLQYSNHHYPINVALLNAFNHDLYYGIQTTSGKEIGCMRSGDLFSQLLERFPSQPINFIGNGAALYKNTITELFHEACIPDPLPEECSLQQLAIMTQTAFQKGQGLVHSLLPHYLKNIAYKPHMNPEQL